MLVAKKFIESSIQKYGKHSVYTDGDTWYYIQKPAKYKLKQYLYSTFQRSLMERFNQYFKDRIESFDDYYPCIQH